MGASVVAVGVFFIPATAATEATTARIIAPSVSRLMVGDGEAAAILGTCLAWTTTILPRGPTRLNFIPAGGCNCCCCCCGFLFQQQQQQQ